MNRQFQFQIKKALSEQGELTGIAAVYETLDLGGDRIKRGAMAKSISENPHVPLLLDHRIPIGVAYCTDTEEGLEVRCKLNLEKSVSQEAFSDLKFYLAHETDYGMSIGYDVVKSSRDGDTRVLNEIKIWETSITLFPMNPAAGVRGVKAREELETVLADIKAEREAFEKVLNDSKPLVAEFVKAVHDLSTTALHSEAADPGTSEKGAAQPAAAEPIQPDHSRIVQLFKSFALENKPWN